MSIDRDSLEWTIAGVDKESALTFRLDTSNADGCDVSVHYLVQEDVEPGEIPRLKDSKNVVNLDRCANGLGQSCRASIGRGLDIPMDLQKFGEEKDGFYHLVIDIVARTVADPKVVTRQLTYAKLAGEADKYAVSVSKQRVVCGGRCAQVETLYGNFGGRPRQSASKGEVGIDSGEGTDCVICLTNPRDTAIMPCRHLCLCGTCANVTSSTWSFQCPVCRARVAAMVKLEQLTIAA